MSDWATIQLDENLPSWLEAAGTWLAFTAVAVGLRRERRARRAEERDRRRAVVNELLAASTAFANGIDAHRLAWPWWRASLAGPATALQLVTAATDRLNQAGLAVAAIQDEDLNDAGWAVTQATLAMGQVYNASTAERDSTRKRLEDAITAFRTAAEQLDERRN